MATTVCMSSRVQINLRAMIWGLLLEYIYKDRALKIRRSSQIKNKILCSGHLLEMVLIRKRKSKQNVRPLPCRLTLLSWHWSHQRWDHRWSGGKPNNLFSQKEKGKIVGIIEARSAYLKRFGFFLVEIVFSLTTIQLWLIFSSQFQPKEWGHSCNWIRSYLSTNS